MFKNTNKSSGNPELFSEMLNFQHYRRIFIEKFGTVRGLILEAVSQCEALEYETAEQYQKLTGIAEYEFYPIWRGLLNDHLIIHPAKKFLLNEEMVMQTLGEKFDDKTAS